MYRHTQTEISMLTKLNLAHGVAYNTVHCVLVAVIRHESGSALRKKGGAKHHPVSGVKSYGPTPLCMHKWRLAPTEYDLSNDLEIHL